MDRGYESHLYAALPSGKHLEDLLREAQGIVPMVIRRGKAVCALAPVPGHHGAEGGGDGGGVCCTPCFPSVSTQ